MLLARRYRTPHIALFTTLLLTGLLSACSSSDDPASTQLPEGGSASMPSASIGLVPESRDIASVGKVYTDDNDRSLYTRYTDQPGNTDCVASCADQWPPLITSFTQQGISGNFDVIERDDGTSQWTLLGYPLYTFSGDGAPDEINGDGVNAQWALARPIPASSATVDGDEALVADGSTLADGNSMNRLDRSNYTLYFFESDSDGVSSCNGTCATSWPPLYADTGAVADGDRYTLIIRDDGTRQWAYDSKALYFWQGDSAPGEFLGAQIPNWIIARP